MALSCCSKLQALDRSIEVLHRIQLPTAPQHADSDRVHSWIQQIRTMIRRLHPRIVNHRRTPRLGHILCDHRKPRAGRMSAIRQVGLAGILMRDRLPRRHFARMPLRRAMQRLIPSQRLQATLRALCIRRAEQVLLRHRSNRRRRRRRHGCHRRQQRCRQNRDRTQSHCSH